MFPKTGHDTVAANERVVVPSAVLKHVWFLCVKGQEGFDLKI